MHFYMSLVLKFRYSLIVWFILCYIGTEAVVVSWAKLTPLDSLIIPGIPTYPFNSFIFSKDLSIVAYIALSSSLLYGKIPLLEKLKSLAVKIGRSFQQWRQATMIFLKLGYIASRIKFSSIVPSTTALSLPPPKSVLPSLPKNPVPST